MRKSKNFRTIARAAGVAVPMLALATTSCSRAELAPDCFQIDPATGVCLVPYPGASDVTIACDADTTFPDAALGANYSFNLNDITMGGTGLYSSWDVTGLPPGLSVDEASGEITGTPGGMADIAYQDIHVRMIDAGSGEAYDFESCGEIIVNARLNANQARNEPNHCVPFDASKDEMIALLSGGDGSDITCEAFVDGGSATCPLGDGNGRPPPGITFNDSSCTHSGTIAGNRHGTWVWMVQLTQSDYVITVPYCATNDIGTYHDLIMTANGNVTPNTEPGLLEYDGANSLAFGNGSYHWDINDPACPGNDCNNFGFRFDVTCSPFDAVDPWVITLAPSSGTSTGLMHEMTATGPVVSDKFTKRPFVASFEMDYCTSATPSDCDVNSPTFGQTAQTHYHFDVVGFPTL
ncbi:MAG: hypothetical protein KC431_14290 [Myxococcales bacterium]|nr:hypothetical protein [Myxococcales bacterium]